MLVREEVFFAAQPVLAHESQALCSERQCRPVLHFFVFSEPVDRVRQLAAVVL